MARIAPETVEQIQAASDIVDVVGSYFPLKRSGPVYKALCPFHQERTPSFTVNPHRQIFKCFGCGVGGSVFRFVMNYENLDFVSAAKKLADRAGIRLSEEELSAQDEARVSMRRRLLALHGEAAEFFHQQLLKKPPAQDARDYLKQRGIGTEIAKSWKLGYAPDSYEAFTAFARERGFSAQELAESGLVKLRDEETANRQSAVAGWQFYDRFRGRVMFPIRNDTGEAIAFSGRVLGGDAKAAKYINSPETMLFTKGAVLFGLDRSKRALIDKSSAIVCEGQIDLITAFEAGVHNVIAPQGTAFTERQARILKRYVEEVVLCFDADAAGEKAMERSLVSLLAENLLVRVVEMPPGEDPDSLIRSRGAAVFVERVATAKDFFDFQIEKRSAAPDFDTPRGRMHAARKMAAFVSLISDAVLRETVVNKLTVRLEVSPREFTRMLTAPKKVEADDSGAATRPAVPVDPTLHLLTLLTLRDAGARCWVLAESWRKALAAEPDASLLGKILESGVDVEEPRSLAAFLVSLDASEEAIVAGLLEEKLPGNAMTIAHDCWRELERRQIRRKMDAIQARLRAPNAAAEEILKWQKEILDLQKRVSDITRPFSPPL